MSGDFIVLDGGMGRELMRIGAPFKQPEWSALALIEAPELVQQVHASYIEAGAQVITSNSYSLVPFHIGQERFDAEALALADLAGRLARQAVAASGRNVRVAGSLPPLFGSYQPELFDATRAPQLIAPLIQGLSPHIDFWLAETLSAVAEAHAVADALADDPRERWFSFTLDDGVAIEPVLAGNALPVLRSGESIAEAFAWAQQAGATGFLFNCTQAELMEAAILEAARLRALSGSTIRLGVYANSFVPKKRQQAANAGLSDLREDLGTEAYREFAARWQEAGASIIGGCCGIGPEHIQGLAAATRA